MFWTVLLSVLVSELIIKRDKINGIVHNIQKRDIARKFYQFNQSNSKAISLPWMGYKYVHKKNTSIKQLVIW